jgi:hypothetical protein
MTMLGGRPAEAAATAATIANRETSPASENITAISDDADDLPF